MPEDLLALVMAQQRQLAAMADTLERQTEALQALAHRPELGAELTVSALREAYEAVVVGKVKAQDVRGMLEIWVAHFGSRPALALRASDVIAFRDGERHGMTEQKALRMPGTRNLEVATFLAMYNWAVRDGRLARNPIGRVRPLAVVKRETTIPREDDEAVLEVSTEVMQAAYLLGVDAGMRFNEIRCLEWSWVDLPGKRISLPAAATKTRRARKPRITNRIVAALRALPHHLRAPYVFTRPETERPYSRTTIGRWWRTVRAEAGLRPAPGEKAVTFHATRHTAATRLIEAGVGFKVAMKQLGQTSPAVAVNYIHANEADLDAARDKLDEITAQNTRSVQQRATKSLGQTQGES